MRKRLLVLSLILLLPFSANAWRFMWDVDVKTGFDNREYASMRTHHTSETIFGVVFAPKVGLGFGEGHSIHAGLGFVRYFGNAPLDNSIGPLLYWQYDGEHLRANAGSLPRKRMRGYYPEAFFDPRFYFNGVVEGFLITYKRDWWTVEAALDWLGLMSEEKREKFSAYSYGEVGASWLNLSYTFMMTHYANSLTVSGVVDNVWIYPHIASNVSEFLPDRMSLSLRAGWIQTFQNDRRLQQGYVTPGGVQTELSFEYYGFGLRNTLFTGSNIMPFYYNTDAAGNVYGANLYHGDAFYASNTGLYNRLEVSYRYNVSNMFRLKIASVHHYDGRDWGWQQLVQLAVTLNNY